jgi:glycine betaine/proline transport system ATP-binding protein
MKDGKLVQLATPEEMVTNPVDDYVKAFTRNAPRDKIISLGAIAQKSKGKAGGPKLSADTKLGEAAAQILNAGEPVSVSDADGRVIGVVSREAMIAALYPGADA